MAPPRSLTSKKVLAVVELYAVEGLSCEDLSGMFRVSPATIRRALRDFEQAWAMSILRVPGRPIIHLAQRLHARPNAALLNIIKQLRLALIGDATESPRLSHHMPGANASDPQANKSGGLGGNPSNPFDALLDVSTYRD